MLVLIVVFGFLAPVASLRLRFAATILLAITVGVAFTVATQAAFEQGWVLPFTYPLGALVLSTIGAIGTHYSVAAFERERVRDVFSRFVPEQVVGQVLPCTTATCASAAKTSSARSCSPTCAASRASPRTSRRARRSTSSTSTSRR